MSKHTISARQHLTAVFGTPSDVAQVETALRTAAQHHAELAAHLRARRDAGHFNAPNSLITRDGARQLADGHDRRATTYTGLADRIRVALDTDDEAEEEVDQR